MMTNLLGLAVDTGAPALNVRVQVTPVSAAGITDPATLARQQLVNAVPAPALVAAYSANTPQQQKPILRTGITAPSSALAAQLIAQDISTSEDALGIFKPRPTTSPGTLQLTAEDDYLADLRNARAAQTVPAGILKPATAQPSEEASQAAARADIAVAKLLSQASNETLARTVVAQASTGLPALFTQFIKKPTLANARGLSAYQLAEARNASTRRVPIFEETAAS